MTAASQVGVLEVLEPIADYHDSEESNRKAPARPESIEGKSIALFPNFRAISAKFLEILGQRLKSDTNIKAAFLHDRSDWALNHPEHAERIGVEIDVFAQECDLIISGIGD